jgi:YjbE family integral membrane protein
LLDWELISRFGGILLIDLILSGDNAVVIAMAARRLEGRNRRRAILWGAGGAVGLRLAFASVITLITDLPFLRAVGGLLLFWIAWKLLHDDHAEGEKVDAGQGVLDAIKIIILADVVMSLDNVLALVAVSGGNIGLLAIGLALTIPLVIWGSQILMSIMDRLPWIMYLGAGILIYVAVEMIFNDAALHDYLQPLAGAEWLIGLSVAVVFTVFAWMWDHRTGKTTG